MKVAVACEGRMVTEHFGHCENFNIYNIENDRIVSSESIDFCPTSSTTWALIP